MKRLIIILLLIIPMIFGHISAPEETISVQSGSITQMDLNVEYRYTLLDCISDSWCRDKLIEHLTMINGYYYLEVK